MDDGEWDWELSLRDAQEDVDCGYVALIPLKDEHRDLLELYMAETASFWNRFERLFPLENGILGDALARARSTCAALREHGLSLTARDVALHFAAALREVTEACGYDNDREECRARFEELSPRLTRSPARPA